MPSNILGRVGTEDVPPRNGWRLSIDAAAGAAAADDDDDEAGDGGKEEVR